MEQSQGAAILSIAGGIFLFALVLFLAWLCTRFVAGRFAAVGGRGRIEVLERAAIGPDRALLVVRTAGRVWLLGATAHHIEPIGELDPEQFPAEGPAAAGGPAFSEALQGALKNWNPGKKQEKQDE